MYYVFYTMLANIKSQVNFAAAAALCATVLRTKKDARGRLFQFYTAALNSMRKSTAKIFCFHFPVSFVKFCEIKKDPEISGSFFTLRVFRAYAVMFLAVIIAPYHPQRSRDAQRRVRAADEAHQHDQCEVFRGFAAEEVQRADREQNRRQCIETARNTLLNTVVRERFIRIRFAMRAQVFADAVENNDRFVHRVADDRQNRRQERRVNFQMEQCERAEHD